MEEIKKEYVPRRTNKKKVKVEQFSERLTKLRKERGYSQKKVASDLDISQALLSHYEKGIRECGLNFVVKCSKYYGVTTDYLLGITESRFADTVPNSNTDESLVGKNILSNATKVLVDAVTENRTDITNARYIHDYYMLCLYRAALTLANAGSLSKDMFNIDFTIGHELSSTAIAILDSKFAFNKEDVEELKDMSDSSLALLVEEAEEYLKSNFLD